MTHIPPRGIFVAIGFAVLLHAALFVLVRPVAPTGLSGAAVVPHTHFLPHSNGTLPTVGNDPRLVSSPVLFSLPSSMGFSRELQNQDVKTRLTFSQQLASEYFLQADMESGREVLESRKLMLSTEAGRSPAVPADIFQQQEKRPAARRVTLAPELKERIVGGVVLPAELNQEVSKPWEVRAEISVTAQGAVNHVFLNKPLESAPLNLRILQLLYSLRFNPGEPLDGQVEIYSPESKPATESTP